jgi:hypothetical protein
MIEACQAANTRERESNAPAAAIFFPRITLELTLHQ